MLKPYTPKRSLKVDIKEPCHEDWDAMHPVAGGRHCDMCTKRVVDFTTMADKDIAKYFLHNQNVCGRFRASQLNVGFAIEEEVKPQQAKLLNWLLRAALIVGISLPVKAYSHTKTEIAAPFTKNAEEPTVRTVEISGKVTDAETGDVIEKAQLIINATDTVYTDSTGFYKAMIELTDSCAEELSINITAEFFDGKETVVTLDGIMPLVVDIGLDKIVIKVESPVVWEIVTMGDISVQPICIEGQFTVGMMTGEFFYPMITIPVDPLHERVVPVVGNTFLGVYREKPNIDAEEDYTYTYYVFILSFVFAFTGTWWISRKK